MIVRCLVACVLLAALIQPTRERGLPAVIFAAIAVGHWLFMSHLDGLAYYGSAAFFALVVIAITANLTCISSITRDIHRVCLVAIVLNAVGWCMWMLYLEPVAYNISFIFLYVWAIMVLCRKDAEYAGGGTMDDWAYFLRFNPYTCHRASDSVQEARET